MEKTFIFAGFGGQGMLLIGKFVAMACMLDGKHVSWLPSYGPEMRGGTANCSVIVSDDPVASPLVDKADVIVAMNRPSLDKFEEHVKPGGVPWSSTAPSSTVRPSVTTSPWSTATPTALRSPSATPRALTWPSWVLLWPRLPSPPWIA